MLSYFLMLKFCIYAKKLKIVLELIYLLISAYYLNNYLILFLGICRLCQVCETGNQMIHGYDLLSEVF